MNANTHRMIREYVIVWDTYGFSPVWLNFREQALASPDKAPTNQMTNARWLVADSEARRYRKRSSAFRNEFPLNGFIRHSYEPRLLERAWQVLDTTSLKHRIALERLVRILES